jgi:hypothetical protein
VVDYGRFWFWFFFYGNFGIIPINRDDSSYHVQLKSYFTLLGLDYKSIEIKISKFTKKLITNCLKTLWQPHHKLSSLHSMINVFSLPFLTILHKVVHTEQKCLINFEWTYTFVFIKDNARNFSLNPVSSPSLYNYTLISFQQKKKKNFIQFFSFFALIILI